MQQPLLPLLPVLLLLVALAGAAAAFSSVRDTFATGAPYSFGSGAFGQWQEDEFGAPVYNYTLDQTRDARATYAGGVNAFVRQPEDHFFHLGNDRLVLLGSNFGYVNVRSDERGSKLLNDYLPGSGAQFGGGIGVLSSFSPSPSGRGAGGGGVVLTTQYTGGNGTFDRLFGLGYMRKTVAGKEAQTGASAVVQQDLIVPRGADPVVVSVVTIANTGSADANFTWTESWAAAWYHLDQYSRSLSRAPANTTGPGTQSYLGDFRLFVAEHYTAAFRPAAGAYPGVSVAYNFTGLTPLDVAEMARLEKVLRESGEHNEFVGPVQQDMPAGASIWDTAPPTVTLLDVSVDGFAPRSGSDCSAFFGPGGPAAPNGATLQAPPLAITPDVPLPAACLLAQRTVTLAPGSSATLAFVWSYATARQQEQGVTAEALATRYAAAARNGTLRGITVAANLADGYNFSVPGGAAPWVGREMLWHSYATHAALSFDEFFNETILDQSTAYRYSNGFQGAARDPLQHLLPLLFTRPSAARSIIRFTLAELQPPSSLFLGPPYFLTPWGIVSQGLMVPWGLRPSDLEVYILLAVSEYVLATRDVDFLGESVTTYNRTVTATVGQLLQRVFDYRFETIGTGPHGLMRVEGSDWSDSFCAKVPGCVFNNSEWWDMYARGESHLVTAQAAYALQRLSAALSLAGEPYAALAHSATQMADGLVVALRTYGLADGGPWLRRAWLPGLPAPGWQGNSVLEITQQSWGVLAGVFNASFCAALADAIRTNLSDPSPIGPSLVGVPFPNDPPYGHQENGGVWQGSLNMPWVWALASINATDAWEQFLLNSLAAEATAYGDRVWAGVWSSSDAVDSFLSTTPGFPSWPDMPILCTHRHAWPLWALTKLAGINFDAAGLKLTPAPLHASLLPVNNDSEEEEEEKETEEEVAGRCDQDAWELATPAVSIRAHANGSWTGHFAAASRAAGRAIAFEAALPTSNCNSTWELRISAHGHAPILAAALTRAPLPHEAAAWAASPASSVVHFAVHVPAAHFVWQLTAKF